MRRMITTFLMAVALAGCSVPVENPGLSGIPVDSPVTVNTIVRQDAGPAAAAIVARRVSGGLEVTVDGFPACPTTSAIEIKGVRSAGLLALTATASPNGLNTATFSCGPNATTRLELNVETNGPVFTVNLIDGSGLVLATAQVK